FLVRDGERRAREIEGLLLRDPSECGTREVEGIHKAKRTMRGMLPSERLFQDAGEILFGAQPRIRLVAGVRERFLHDPRQHLALHPCLAELAGKPTPGAEVVDDRG